MKILKRSLIHFLILINFNYFATAGNLLAPPSAPEKQLIIQLSDQLDSVTNSAEASDTRRSLLRIFWPFSSRSMQPSTIETFKVSRRSFLKWPIAAAVVLAIPWDAFAADEETLKNINELEEIIASTVSLIDYNESIDYQEKIRDYEAFKAFKESLQLTARRQIYKYKDGKRIYSVSLRRGNSYWMIQPHDAIDCIERIIARLDEKSFTTEEDIYIRDEKFPSKGLAFLAGKVRAKDIKSPQKTFVEKEQFKITCLTTETCDWQYLARMNGLPTDPEKQKNIPKDTFIKIFKKKKVTVFVWQSLLAHLGSLKQGKEGLTYEELSYERLMELCKNKEYAVMAELLRTRDYFASFISRMRDKDLFEFPGDPTYPQFDTYKGKTADHLIRMIPSRKTVAQQNRDSIRKKAIASLKKEIINETLRKLKKPNAPLKPREPTEQEISERMEIEIERIYARPFAVVWQLFYNRNKKDRVAKMNDFVEQAIQYRQYRSLAESI